jgi:hypothetical protein
MAAGPQSRIRKSSVGHPQTVGRSGGYVPDGQVATAVFSVFKVDGGTIDDESSYRMSIIPVFNREQVIGLADMKTT